MSLRTSKLYAALLCCLLSALSFGCASGLLVSEGEDLMEQGELQEAISRYDEALLKRPAWPQSVEDESTALSALREQLSLRINERALKALKEQRWEDACRAAVEADYLDGVSPAGPSLKLMSPVLSELERRFDEHLVDPERWGELELLIRGLERCLAPPEMIEEALARLVVVATISLAELESALSAPRPKAEQRQAWDEIARLEQRLALYEGRLPRSVWEMWEARFSTLREAASQEALALATSEGRYGLAWLYASLLSDEAEVTRFAALARAVTLFDVVTHAQDPLVALNISSKLPWLRVTAADQRGGGEVGLSDQLLSLSAPAPRHQLWLSLREEAPTCVRRQEEESKELRLVDHYEERPTPEWLKAIVKVEAAQTRFEALSANLSELLGRLDSERDQLVRDRLQLEVDHSSVEVEEAEALLTALEHASERLPKVIREPIYVIFRYPVTRWTLSCELSWTLSLSAERRTHDRGEALADKSSAPELLSWSVKTESVDYAHRAYPQHQVGADPLRFPETERALKLRARERLTAQLRALLHERAEGVRRALYAFSQGPSQSASERRSQLDTLATLALTHSSAREVELFLELLSHALSRDPRWMGPLSPHGPDELSLGLGALFNELHRVALSP